MKRKEGRQLFKESKLQAKLAHRLVDISSQRDPGNRERLNFPLCILCLQYEKELSDLREELLETKRTLASTHEQLILQESSTHKLVASFKERLAESENSLQQLRQEKDREMKELLDRLVSVESELRKEQKEMQEVIHAKQVIIEAQERRIKSVDSNNAKLIATLNQVRGSRTNSKVLNYPSSDLQLVKLCVFDLCKNLS